MIFIQKYLYKSSAGYNFAQHSTAQHSTAHIIWLRQYARIIILFLTTSKPAMEIFLWLVCFFIFLIKNNLKII